MNTLAVLYYRFLAATVCRIKGHDWFYGTVFPSGNLIDICARCTRFEEYECPPGSLGTSAGSVEHFWN